MTQVANLTAGMAVPAKGDTSFLKREQSQLVIEEFASIMNQNAQGFMNTATDFGAGSDGASDDGFSVNDATGSLKKDYEKFGSSGSRKITQAKEESPDTDGFSEKVQELADKVKKAVQETMQVSEEDIEAAMEVLGLDAIDLLQPQNLIGVVQEVTGNADVSALLTSENFQMTMQEVTGLIAGFQQDNGLNAVQFSDLLAQLSAQVDELEKTVKELLGVSSEVQTEQPTDIQTSGSQEQLQMEQKLPEENAQTMQATEQTIQPQNPVAQPVQSDASSDPEQLNAQPVELMAEEEPKASDQTADQEENPTLQGEKNKQQTFTAADHESAITEHNAGIFRENVVMTNEQPAVVQSQTPQIQNYVELEQLMNQMEGLARTFASAEETTVEMQLNPESLGRLVLTVTEKHGNVTAQIAASNEQVKEALQTQLVELRATLQAQGIKVEAVEVTVATHEFEQNLDGNTSANGQMQEQAGRQSSGQQSGRRNLDRNSLDELSGLMSEEETLVAQMMRDNGGTVDYTA